MINAYIPYQQLNAFKQWLGLDEEELKKLEPFKDLFISRKEDFARYFHDFFMKIQEAKFIIEHEERPGHLFRSLAHWFEMLFSSNLNEEFLSYLWNVGLKHVEIKLDQRFSNTGFSVARQFCHELILSELSPEKATEILNLTDRLIDFCLLVETDAYIETTTRCDLEVVKGVADRIRNPVSVIGGNIRRLLKNADVKDPAYQIYEFISSQSTKCERMVRDIKTYIDIFERKPLFEKISLEGLIEDALEGLLASGKYTKPDIEIKIGHDSSCILADKENMQSLFEHLLENSLEALEIEKPVIRIASSREGAPPHSVMIEIFNTGTPPREEDMGKLFSPFYTTKSWGTGFGLPIARQAVRNNVGRLRIEPVKDEGTKIVLTLPLCE